MKLPAMDIVMIMDFVFVMFAFIFHKYLPKKFLDRRKISDVIREFLWQSIGYVVIPFFIVVFFHCTIYEICNRYSSCGKCEEFDFLSVLHTYLVDIAWAKSVKSWIVIVTMCLISVPFLIFGLRFKKLKEEYPLWKNFVNSPMKYKIAYEVIYLLYYINWEYFFRGVLLLFVLSEGGCKVFPEFVIYNIFQTIFAGLFHYDKPLQEFILSFPVNFLFGCIAFAYNSIVPCIIIHYFIGVTFDLLVSHIKQKSDN